MNLLRTKLLLARLLTLALLVAVAASPFGRAPLGATLVAKGHAHCPGHASSHSSAQLAANVHHAHSQAVVDPAQPAPDHKGSIPSTPKGDSACCLAAVGVQQPPLVTPAPNALTAQRLAARNDAAVADLTPDGPQRPPRTRDHA